MSSPIHLSFFVPGVPAPGGSKKGFYNKKLGRVLIVPASKKTKPWMQAVAGTVGSEYHGELLTGPIRLNLIFLIQRPKGHYGTGKNAGVIKNSCKDLYPTTKPDLTKLVRSTEDALTGIIWRDDSQVVSGLYGKIYCTKNPGVDIVVMELKTDLI